MRFRSTRRPNRFFVIEIVVLGTAAGGGFPQWNCHCENCRLWAGGALPGRKQSSVAVRGSGAGWALINASPDVASQVRSLAGHSGENRFSPVGRIFLTNADIDHVSGLLQLREGGLLKVTAPPGVWRSLAEGLRFPQVLSAYCGMEQQPLTWDWDSLPDLGLEVRMVALREAAPPRYHSTARQDGHGVGYLFRERAGGGVLGVFPDVAELDAGLVRELSGCDIVFFDGTFWDDAELSRQNCGTRTAREMGHVPVSGPQGSLNILAGLEIPTRAYLHINNTNPILRPDSPERREVERRGVRVADDGMRFVL